MDPNTTIRDADQAIRRIFETLSNVTLIDTEEDMEFTTPEAAIAFNREVDGATFRVRADNFASWVRFILEPGPRTEEELADYGTRLHPVFYPGETL